MEQKKLSPLAIFVVILATIGGSIIGGMLYKNSREPMFDEVLVQVANELNQTCPFFVDSETRLENLIAGPGNMLTYNYTLVNLTVDQIDAEELKLFMTEKIVPMIQSDISMELLREKEVIFKYKYRDKNNIYITEFDIGPDLYLDNTDDPDKDL